MNAWHPFAESIRLHVPDRISEADARRQEMTAREILQRLKERPGVVLADEVGMGKTFVAIAVAISVALSDTKRRPVVVMVPSGLKEKWPRELAVFAEKCLDVSALPNGWSDYFRQYSAANRSAPRPSADSAIELLRLLETPRERRHPVVFLTHGAMHRGLSDGWIKLAVIQRALRGRHNTDELRHALSKCLGGLLQLEWVERKFPQIWDRLLGAPFDDWRKLLRRRGIGGTRTGPDAVDDSPLVPKEVANVLRDFDTSEVFELLRRIKVPQLRTDSWKDRVAAARRELSKSLKIVWRDCLKALGFQLPLLVMDEAHHLKNPKTRLSSLFQVGDANDDAEEVSRGELSGIFERMLFLTATPFQLGHHELCSVLERFDGIAWESPDAPKADRKTYHNEVRALRDRLDAAQHAALNLDCSWGRLRRDDIAIGGEVAEDVDAWWTQVPSQVSRTPTVEVVLDAYRTVSEKMRAAEELLRPWVIRHLKPRCLANGSLRRECLPGAAIIDDRACEGDTGLQIPKNAILPFLLAARATMCAPDSRPLFAEGLASSYEAFLHTRESADALTDDDDDPIGASSGDGVIASRRQNDARIGRWYLEKLEEALPLRDHHDSAAHPKVSATAKRVLAAWSRGEKVVVFCHYVRTGRVLRQVISGLMNDEITRRGAERIGCSESDTTMRLDAIGDQFFDTDSPVRRACDEEVGKLIEHCYQLRAYRDKLLDLARRYLRTPSFLVRYFPLGENRLDPAAVRNAFAVDDGSGLSLRGMLAGFFDYLDARCGQAERDWCLEAIQKVQTGRIRGREATAAFADDEVQGSAVERLLPNVRLVNGMTGTETRQRLMLTFNSPFFPEVLIASSVMAEGVDLHRFCRYVIHHDLCWNPSTLEQRTGRIDRIGAKAEQCGRAIRVYLPYLAETQDEKMYRVVLDRERWFNVVMGGEFRADTRTTDSLAHRIPLPESLAAELAFRLDLAANRP